MIGVAMQTMCDEGDGRAGGRILWTTTPYRAGTVSKLGGGRLERFRSTVTPYKDTAFVNQSYHDGTRWLCDYKDQDRMACSHPWRAGSAADTATGAHFSKR